MTRKGSQVRVLYGPRKSPGEGCIGRKGLAQEFWVYCSHGNCDVATATTGCAPNGPDRDGTVRAPSTLGTQSLAAFHQRIGVEHFFDGSIGPEAFINPKGFKRAVRLAAARLTNHEEYGRRG
jgi:hypothetical protein